MPLFGSAKPPQTPRVSEQAIVTLELLNDGALRTIREITGPIGVGDLVTVTPKDPTNWGSVELNATVGAVGVVDIDYGADQHFSFLTLDLGGEPRFVTCEGEGNNREWRCFAFHFVESDELIAQLRWCLNTYLEDQVNETRDFLLSLPNARPFDDGTEKTWTAYSARHGTHHGLLGSADFFPSFGASQVAEYQDCTFSLGPSGASPLLLRFIAIGEYSRALIGEELTIHDVKVQRTT